ncbi:hypothetical protein EYR41_007414 [Orbilia oligospora]|uniref:Uncharacterized protein n=1 Tax=Orbilia oligospora TaxID=2813651 RepID=A0A7C8P4E9_ORBOL|nr:hypothetical protein TWF751_002650 [Orbilia oligospora]TGJ68359.1 hypothetical protein EYR41_007414 [Orbilia oligospora]
MEQSLQTQEPSPLTLETMPPEIRNQIYGCLLDSRACDKSMDTNGKSKPQFHTSILYVNKKTYKEAHGILYGSSGPIVTVTFYMDGIEAALKRGLVSFHPSRYTRSIAGRQLHIIIKPTFVAFTKREPFVFVLAGMEDIKSFYRFLKFLNWGENDGRGISYEFNFEPYHNVFEDAPSTSDASSQVHKDLVEAFCGLRASFQTCTSKGLANSNLEAFFVGKLNDRVIWLQGEILELWMNSFELYQKACQLSVEGSFDAALSHYGYIISSYTNCIETNPLLQSPDASLDGSIVSRLITIITAAQASRSMLYVLGSFSDKYKDSMKAKVNLAELEKILEGNEAMVAGFGGAVSLLMVPKMVNSAVWQTIAVLRMICGDTSDNIANAWHYAAGLLDDEEEKARLQGLKEHALASGSPHLRLATRIEVAKMYMQDLPFPVRPYEKHKPVKSTSVVNERYILHKLKYTGPLYRQDIRMGLGKRKLPDSDETVRYGDRVDGNHCWQVLNDVRTQVLRFRGSYDFSVWVGPENFYFKGSNSNMRDMGIPSREFNPGYPFETIRFPC